ncbi:formin-J isoform X2 [Drosophila obscura]|uniref:formin-J isoform X2 n=1 Tax=Drosophila obscura TaxID=7282 RepID=UPI001BB21F90|nr:formin-J isoform X2 [Drosophila obscura]
MSKKMWNKIFKSKSQKPQPLAKINKRHSRGIYEEYQQLNDLLASEKTQLNFCNQRENENGNGNGCGNGNGYGSSINVFEQQPQQSSFNSLQLSEAQQSLPQQHQQRQQQQQQQQQPQQQLSTFSRVRNTFSLKRNSNNSSSSNKGQKNLPNAKSSESDPPPGVGAEPATTTAAAAATSTNNNNQLQRILIVVNKIDVLSTNQPTNNHLHAKPSETASATAPAIKPTAFNTENELEAPGGGQEEEPSSPPPPPLTSGLLLPVPEIVAISASDLTPCPCCSRTFNLNALRKHVVICEKTSKKRNIFDSSRQRREGTVLSTYVLPKNFGLPNADKVSGVHTPLAGSRDAVGTGPTMPTDSVGSPLPTRRKSQTELVRSTARASVRRAGGTATGTTAAETSPAGEPSSVPVRDRSLAKRIKSVASEHCPHCERNFNVKAFDRHVEWCKEKAIQATIKLTNPQETSKAKERLDARKQYRPPNLKTKRSINRSKYSGNHEDLLDAGDMTAPKQNLMSLSSMTSSVHSDNGLSGVSVSSDKYDPFLSARRQLEELCTPGTPPEEVPPTAPPSISMTSSLTMPSSRAAPTTPKPTPASNFRRTSSLRGPRRTPLLPSRPLFATNYRPTIQRGLSDEGPISTNFLKPEEYDEMPVRAACGNDFHSPRVVRRDTSTSNRKQLLKLPLGVGAASEKTAQAQPGRNVAKTDSLAVFLNYEHELEQLNAKAAEVAAANQLTSKELKDKSNNLSKQNSAKSLTATSTNPGQLPPLTPSTLTPSSAPATAPTPAPAAVSAKENNEKRMHNNYQPIATPLRLEPISRPATAMPAVQQPVSVGVTSLTPIKLESIFGFGRPAAVGGGEFIDPKLINACDNLHVSSGVPSDASSTPQQLSQSRSRSSSQSTITYERRQSGEARNLLKRKMRLGRNQFLYDASPEDADASSGCSADDEANRSSMEYDEQCWQQQQKQLLANPLPLVMPMGNMPTFDDFDFEEFLSSFENENDDEQFPLFKDCREFLLNRTTSRQRSFQKATSTPQQTATATLRPATTSSIFQPKSQPTKDSHAHRSNSNSLNGKGDEKLQLQMQMQRQQSNASSVGSHDEKMPQKMQQMPVQMVGKRPAEEQQKREIFISIETETNDHGRSPISPDSLRHMVGNSQTPIDVLHIENGNEPEHARFRKISDTEDPYVDAQGEPDDRASQLTGNANRLTLSSSDSVQVNNAKNLIQQMQSEFRQMGEDAGASIRTLFIRRPEQQTDPEPVQQLQQLQQQVKAGSPMTPSASADSDELSSLDGYPMSSSHSSRRGASSKLSSDSAYGSTNSPYSLSRQRSGDLQPGTPRNQSLLRPHTASAKLPSAAMTDASTQAHNAYATLKARQRLYGGGGTGNNIGNGNTDGAESSSSGSEHSLIMATQQPQEQQQHQQQQHNRPDSNYNYQQQQQQQQHQVQSQPAYNSNNNNNNNNNGQMPLTPTTSQHSLLSSASASSLSSIKELEHFY